MRKKFEVSWSDFVILWISTLLLPLSAYRWMPSVGVTLGIVLPILWVTQMPMTCRSAGFIAVPTGMIQAAAGLSWMIVMIKILVR